MSNLKTVKLYGELGKKFGREFHLDVASPAEAVKLLCANFKDFKSFFIGEDGKKEYHILLNEQDLDTEEAFYPSSPRETIKIIPVVQGSEDANLRIAIGIALVVGSGGISAFLGLSAVTGAATISAIGYGLIIGGVSQLLFPMETPVHDIEDSENTPSYNFDGPVNTVRQGNPVPVGYGRLRVGSQVISAGFFSEGFK